METHLKIIGTAFIALALVHIIFPKYFNWKEELAKLSLVNREIFKVHTFFIALTVFLMGLLCTFYSTEIIQTKLGKAISLGLLIFWGLRLLTQFFGYSSTLWKGKAFETIIHITSSFFWFYLVYIFSIIYFNHVK